MLKTVSNDLVKTLKNKLQEQINEILALKECSKLIRKKGFVDTLRVLISAKNHKLSKRDFYKKLNEFSYYNSFLRIKYDLIKREIIKFKSKEIALTPKGLNVITKITELSKILEGD